MGRLYYEKLKETEDVLRHDVIPIKTISSVNVKNTFANIHTSEVAEVLESKVGPVNTGQTGGALAAKTVVAPLAAKERIEKVTRLIPSEIIAGYLAMVGFATSIEESKLQNIVLWVIFGSCIVLTPIYLSRIADTDKPKRNHLIVSTFAFVVWAYATTGGQLWEAIFHQAIASIVLVLFSLFSAIVPLSK